MILSRKYGVFLTKCQPLHIGHLEVIKHALSENDMVLVVIGSADKSCTERNPLPLNIRIALLDKGIDYITSPVLVDKLLLRDLSSDQDIPKQDNITGVVDDPAKVNKEWGSYLYYNIVNKIGRKTFTLYYNDDISIVESWFPDYIRDRITIKSAPRLGNYSSGAVREAFKEMNMSYLKEALPYLDENSISKLGYCIKVS